MGVASYPIQVLAEMVAEFDNGQVNEDGDVIEGTKEPKPGRKTTAFIKRWRAKELKEKHTSKHHLQMAIRDINPTEIQNIRETKKFRDEQKEKKKQGHVRGGKEGGRLSAKKRAVKKQPEPVKAPLRRNVIW